MKVCGKSLASGLFGFALGVVAAVVALPRGAQPVSPEPAAEPQQSAAPAEPAVPTAPGELSLRKSAPYVVTTDVLAPAQLREMLAKSGARVINCFTASKALVDANEAVLKGMAADARYYKVEALSAEAKVSADVRDAPEGPVRVRLVPMSSMDVGQIVRAVAEFGGEATGSFTPNGRPFVNATIPSGKIMDIARRGDVLRMEKGE